MTDDTADRPIRAGDVVRSSLTGFEGIADDVWKGNVVVGRFVIPPQYAVRVPPMYAQPSV